MKNYIVGYCLADKCEVLNNNGKANQVASYFCCYSDYDGSEVLEDRVRCVLQSRYLKFEIIVVDNRNAGESYKIAEKYTPKIKLQDRYFRPQDPLQKHTNNLACRWKLDMMKTISSYRVFGEDHGQHDELSNVNYM